MLVSLGVISVFPVDPLDYLICSQRDIDDVTFVAMEIMAVFSELVSDFVNHLVGTVMFSAAVCAMFPWICCVYIICDTVSQGPCDWSIFISCLQS